MAQVKKYKAEVVSIVNHVDNVYTVELKSLSGRFKYMVGQFLHLSLDEYDPSQGWPESRCFSMQSSPLEENIKIAFSVKGNFTSKMALELKKGKVIDLKLPYGELFQKDHSKEKVVFIAGGTGVTPFLSMFSDPMFNEYMNATLYFGVREARYNIYSVEFDRAKMNNSFFLIQVVHQDKEGILNIETIFNQHGTASTYFISGPQSMITLFKHQLIELNVPEWSIKTDEWE